MNRMLVEREGQQDASGERERGKLTVSTLLI